jgi:hypothetical protein
MLWMGKVGEKDKKEENNDTFVRFATILTRPITHCHVSCRKSRQLPPKPLSFFAPSLSQGFWYSLLFSAQHTKSAISFLVPLASHTHSLPGLSCSCCTAVVLVEFASLLCSTTTCEYSHRGTALCLHQLVVVGRLYCMFLDSFHYDITRTYPLSPSRSHLLSIRVLALIELVSIDVVFQSLCLSVCTLPP